MAFSSKVASENLTGHENQNKLRPTFDGAWKFADFEELYHKYHELKDSR